VSAPPSAATAGKAAAPEKLHVLASAATTRRIRLRSRPEDTSWPRAARSFERRPV
jgi:hypothetical protein